MPGFKLSVLTDSVGQRVAENDLFRIVSRYEDYPEKTGYISYADKKFFLTFSNGEKVDLESNSDNIEIIGIRELNDVQNTSS